MLDDHVRVDDAHRRKRIPVWDSSGNRVNGCDISHRRAGVAVGSRSTPNYSPAT